MQTRIAYDKAASEGVKAMWTLENYVRHCGLEPALLELVKFRASQINGCAYCIDMHTKDARAHGETEQRSKRLAAPSTSSSRNTSGVPIGKASIKRSLAGRRSSADKP